MLLSVTMEHGQGLVEYALILVLIALVIIIGLSAFGVELNNTYKYITDNFPTS